MGRGDSVGLLRHRATRPRPGTTSRRVHVASTAYRDTDRAQAFRDQSLDDILATRSKAVVLASDTSGGALESLSSATFVASKEEDKIALDDPDFWSVTQCPFPNVS